MDLIAIIEDEDDMRDLLEFHLKSAGFDTESFINTQNVEELLYEENVDLMIVDRNLPGAEGAEFIAALREKGITTPVIFLTAKNSGANISEGFEKGGDDYVTKPFVMEHLIARINAILKRTKHNTTDTIIHRDLKLFKKSHKVYIGSEEVSLTKLEFDLLSELITHKNSILSRYELLENVWDNGDYNQKTVNVAIQRLKQKIDPDGSKDYIQAIRGSGYIIN